MVIQNKLLKKQPQKCVSFPFPTIFDILEILNETILIGRVTDNVNKHSLPATLFQLFTFDNTFSIHAVHVSPTQVNPVSWGHESVA